MKEKKQFTKGSDPEFILINKNRRPVSAIPVVVQDKFDPFKLPNCNVYHDNVLVEMTVKPAKSNGEFVDHLGNSFNDVSKLIGKDYQLAPIPSHTFSAEECEHPDAKEFGCDPEYCAYDVEEVTPPAGGEHFRSGGGHIHIGRTDFEAPADDFLIDPYSKLDMVKIMDVVVGNALTVLDDSEEARERKKLYGKAGRHRPCPYGVEYRTPSNSWLTSPELADFVGQMVDFCLEIGEQDHDKILSLADESRANIDNHSVGAIVKLFEREKVLPSRIMESFNALRKKGGLNPLDFVKHWNL